MKYIYLRQIISQISYPKLICNGEAGHTVSRSYNKTNVPTPTLNNNDTQYTH